MADLTTLFRTLPAPTWERKRAVPALKAEATEVLHGVTPTTRWWNWVAHGPDAKQGKSATPNQHGVGLGVAALHAHIRLWRREIDRWFTWQEAALMGKTYRRAEALGGDYQQLYILAACLISLAAHRQDEQAVYERAVMDIRRHAAINRLLRLPGAWPPRSYSFGCRTAIPDETVPQALACVLAGLPPKEWGEHGGQSLGKQLDRPHRLTGVAVLRIMLDEGLIALPELATMDDVLAEIEATGLRLPWPMHWRAAGIEPVFYMARFEGDFPDGGERTGGILKGVTSREIFPLSAVIDWDLTIGPDGLQVHRRPGEGTKSPPATNPDKPTPPPRPPDPDPPTTEPDPRYIPPWMLQRILERRAPAPGWAASAIPEIVDLAQKLRLGDATAEGRLTAAVEAMWAAREAGE